MGETPNPFFNYRDILKRKGLEETDLYLYINMIYFLMYFIFRGIGITIFTYPLVLSIKVTFIMKLVYLPLVFTSYGWLLVMASAFWKMLPRMYADPKKVEKTEWWLRGRAFFKYWVKDAPGIYISISLIILITMVIPMSFSYYAHFIDNSFGYSE